MTISAFCLITNPKANQYPFIESIKSFLPVVNELIVVDGGSTDGSLEDIKAIGDLKIRIISDEDTKWEEDWEYSRMSHNFNRGYQECSGDLAIKFDVDFVFHEKHLPLEPDKSSFLKYCENALKNKKLTLTFIRRNFILIDRSFIKKGSVLGVNKALAKELNLDIRYGLDDVHWGWGNTPIIYSYTENGIHFGLQTTSHSRELISSDIFNYGFAFHTAEKIEELRRKHELAILRQLKHRYNTAKLSDMGYSLEHALEHPTLAWEKFAKGIVGSFSRRQDPLTIEEHPKEIRERIKAMTSDMQGYGCWGLLKEKYGVDKAKYFN